MLTRILTTAICCAAFALSAQNVTVINRFQGDAINDVPENYVLSDVREQTIIINDYEAGFNTRQALLEQMISYGLKSYIDNNFTVIDNRVRVNSSAADFDESASAIVKNAIWINDLPFSELFNGFSDNVLNQAEYLRELNGLRILESSDQISISDQSVSLYGFQSLVFGLKESAIEEAHTFIQEFFPDESVPDGGDERKSPYDYMDTEDFDLMASPEAEIELGDLSLSPDLFSSNKNSSRKNRRRRSDFSEEVLTLLENNNRILSDYSEMFKSLQYQIDEINRRDNSDLREDMAQMRRMIADLKSEPLRNNSIPEPTYLIFEKNEYSLSEVQKARLNKTVVLLVKNPTTKALVTGYADLTGDSEYNAWLSQQRAESVKLFLVSMGVDKSRIVVTYFGDTESTTSSPADRRVEVSLID